MRLKSEMFLQTTLAAFSLVLFGIMWHYNAICDERPEYLFLSLFVLQPVAFLVSLVSSIIIIARTLTLKSSGHSAIILRAIFLSICSNFAWLFIGVSYVCVLFDYVPNWLRNIGGG
jgi:hypothetical protein